MENATGVQVMVSGGHSQRVVDQAGAHMVSHRIADDFPVEAVDHRRQIQPARPGGNVGDVADVYEAEEFQEIEVIGSQEHSERKKQLDKRDRKLTAALLIEVEDDEVVRRLSGRRICVKNSHLYHVEFDPPKNEGICDQDGSRLIQRDDDKPETVRKRLSVYHDQTEPLIEHYEDKGLLRRFDGKRPPGEVHDHIRATLATLRLEEEL